LIGPVLTVRELAVRELADLVLIVPVLIDLILIVPVLTALVSTMVLMISRGRVVV